MMAMDFTCERCSGDVEMYEGEFKCNKCGLPQGGPVPQAEEEPQPEEEE